MSVSAHKHVIWKWYDVVIDLLIWHDTYKFKHTCGLHKSKMPPYNSSEWAVYGIRFQVFTLTVLSRDQFKIEYPDRRFYPHLPHLHNPLPSLMCNFIKEHLKSIRRITGFTPDEKSDILKKVLASSGKVDLSHTNIVLDNCSVVTVPHMLFIPHQTIKTKCLTCVGKNIFLYLNILASGTASKVNKALLWYANMQGKWDSVGIKCLAYWCKSWSRFVFVQSVVPPKGAGCWELSAMNSVLNYVHTNTRSL